MEASPRSLKPLRPTSKSEMAETSETPIIAVDRLPLSYDEFKPYLSTGVRLHIEVSESGHSLRKPLTVSPVSYTHLTLPTN